VTFCHYSNAIKPDYYFFFIFFGSVGSHESGACWSFIREIC
jgi:hypothetical protein